MSYAIRFVALAGTTRNEHLAKPGDYLAAYDPDGMDGAGVAAWTPDVDRAMRFASIDAARETFWMQSVVRPVRADGQPNRPLRAYTVEVVAL